MTVLVDGSGSMTGFFTTGALPRLLTQLEGVGARRTQAFTFRALEDGRVSGGLTSVLPTSGNAGNVTLLWRGLSTYLREAPDGEMIAMVTDNVQDAGTVASEARDIRAFYDALASSDRIGYVYVVPLRLPFDGPLYGPAGSIGRYSDERGLVVYLIATTPVDTAAPPPQMRQAIAEHRARAEQVAEAIGGTAVRMKPYRYAPILATVDTAATRNAPVRGGDCPTIPLRPDPDSPQVLVATRPVQQNAAFGGTFRVRLDSRLEGVTLSKPAVSATITERFVLTGFVADGEAELTATPPRLDTDLEPGDSAAVWINICFPSGVKFAPGQKLATATRASGPYAGTVTVGLTVPRTDLRLAEQVRREYSVTDPAFLRIPDRALHRRIYGLEYAFRSLAPESVLVEQSVQGHLRFAILVPKGPLLWLIARWFLLILLVVLFLWVITRSTGFRLAEDGGGRFRISPLRARNRTPTPRANNDDPFDAAGLAAGRPADQAIMEGLPIRLSLFHGHPIRRDGKQAAVLRVSILGTPKAKARPGFVVDGKRARTLHPSGDTFTVSPAAAVPPPTAGATSDRATSRPTDSFDPDGFL